MAEIVLEAGFHGDGGGKKVRVRKTSLRIGRAPDCEIAVDSDVVSRHHVEIALDAAGRWLVRDLGTSNGTFLNRRRVSEAELRPGDVLRLGEGGPKVRVLGLDPGPDDAGDDLEATRYLRVPRPGTVKRSFPKVDVTTSGTPRADPPPARPKPAPRTEARAARATPGSEAPSPPRRRGFPFLLVVGLLFGAFVGLDRWTPAWLPADVLAAPARWLAPRVSPAAWLPPAVLALWFGAAGLALSSLRRGLPWLLVLAAAHYVLLLDAPAAADSGGGTPAARSTAAGGSAPGTGERTTPPETVPPPLVVPVASDPEAGVRGVRRAASWIVYRRVRGDAPRVRLNPIVGQSAVVADGTSVFVAGRLRAGDGARLWVVELDAPPADAAARTPGGDALPPLAAGSDADACLLGEPASPAACLIYRVPADVEAIVVGDRTLVPRTPSIDPPMAGEMTEAALEDGLAHLGTEPVPGLRFRAAVPDDVPERFPALRAGDIVQALAATEVDGAPVPLFLSFDGEAQVAGRLEVDAGLLDAADGAFTPVLEAAATLPALGGRRLVHSVPGVDR